MNDQLVVNFAALNEASGHIATAISTLQTKLGDLEKDAQPLVAAWDGNAKEAYAARQHEWRRASGELANILNNIKRALDQSAQDYLATEQRNRNLFS